MKSMLICFLISACVACGTSEFDPIDGSSSSTQQPGPKAKSSKPVVDADLQRFVAEFMTDCEARRTDCAKRLARIDSIKVVPMKDENEKDNEVIIGLCHDSLFSRRIEINKDIMGKPDMYLRALIYHEIGHCAYNLDHDVLPDMIMSPVMPNFMTLLQHWSSMLSDFFAEIQQKHGD